MSEPVEELGTFAAADGTRLAWTRLRTGSPYLIVVSPGIFMDRRGPEHRLLARRLAGVADVLTMDVRGHGDSGGAFSFGVREPDDLAALTLALRPEYARVGGLGFSFGGFHTLVAAARHQCFDAVAAVAAPHRLWILDHNFLTTGLWRCVPLMLRRQRRFTRLGLPPRGRPIASRLVDRIAPRPLLVVHGTDDWLISPSHARRIHAAAGEPKELLLIERGLHGENMLLDEPEPLLSALVSFFERALAGACRR
jgi:uncharacterized protein